MKKYRIRLAVAFAIAGILISFLNPVATYSQNANHWEYGTLTSVTLADDISDMCYYWHTDTVVVSVCADKFDKTKYKYYTDEFYAKLQELYGKPPYPCGKVFNYLGSMSWELVAVSSIKRYETIFYYKREKK